MKKNSKDQIMQALAGLLPENVQQDVITAVGTFVEGVREELEKEYNSNLEKAYGEVAAEKAELEKTAEQGYAEAYQIICDLRDRLEVQREEFEQALEEGYEEAYQMLLQERGKNESLEVELYEEYDRKVHEIREFYVEKLDQFLSQKGEEFYEQVKRDVLNDPTMAEHKVALDKILEVASCFLSDDDQINATGTKVEAIARQLDELRGQYKIMEAKNMRLSTENNRLNEAVRQHGEMLTETTRHEQKERQKKSKNVEGRGQRIVDRQMVIGEHTANETATSVEDEDDDRGTRFVEQVGEDITKQWSVLAGIEKKK